MSTPNLVLSMILCVILGFAIGNIWGRESMKRTFSVVLEKLTESIKMTVDKKENKKEE